MENIQRATPQKFSNAVYRHFHIYTMGMLFYTRQERLDYFITRAPNILFTLHTHTFQLCFIYYLIKFILQALHGLLDQQTLKGWKWLMLDLSLNYITPKASTLMCRKFLKNIPNNWQLQKTRMESEIQRIQRWRGARSDRPLLNFICHLFLSSLNRTLQVFTIFQQYCS